MARQLLATSSERGPVKLAIVLLGVLGDHSDVADLMTLARHDEFTLYCAVALSGLLADPVDALWQVAQVTHGWGKVETVERLAPAARGRPDIQRWLLTDGCANAVMNEYLAYPCAVHGGLAEALQGPVDDALLDGACTIVSALVSGGPAEDISDYEDADDVVERLVGLLGERCTLERLRTVVALRDRDPRCDAILAHPRWPEVVRAGFRDGVWVWDLAEAVEVDLFEDAFARLDEFVFGDVWHLMRDDARSARVVRWAEAALPLDELASGPALHLFPADHHARARGPRQRRRGARRRALERPARRRGAVVARDQHPQRRPERDRGARLLGRSGAGRAGSPARRGALAGGARARQRSVMWLIACSASAVIVRLGFTPTFAGIAAPSTTSRFS